MADFQSTGKGEDRGSSAGDTLALELRGITKRFPGVLANDRVDLEVRAGEIHALLGENGAGKSTLMNVLYGLYKPDEGEISVFGQHVTLSSSADAIGLGIGMVHQHFMLIPVMTVAENIVLGAEPTSGPMLDLESARKRVAELSETYGLGVRVDARVQDIGVGMQQRAEILKALYREARVLILDEPTAVLTPQEVDEFFEVLRELRSRGVSIVLITHKLDEVLQIADRISVLRRGKKVATIEREGATKPGLASLMVGREVLLAVERTPAVPKEPVLVVEDLWVRDQRDLDAVRGLTLTVHGGEILGIAGIDGNGQTELVEALAGMRHPYRGQIRVDGRDLTHSSPRKVSRSRVGHIPEDRHRHGLVLPFSLAENSVLHDYYRAPIARLRWLRPRAMVERVKRFIERYDVRGGGPSTPAGSLSGGNQQKVVLAREIESDPHLLLAAQPTRGLDVGAIEFVHRALVAQRDAGRAVLLISFELDEILNLADRIVVLYEGRVVLERMAGTTDEQELGLAMTGGNEAEAEAEPEPVP